MKTTLFLSAMLLGGIPAVQGQITLTQVDFPLTDVTVRSLSDTSSAISPGNAGASQTWDFSSFTSGDTSTMVMDYSGFMPHAAFPAANARYCGDMDDDYTICSYMEISAGGLLVHGGTTASLPGASQGMQAVYVSIPAVRSYIFPFTYGSTDSMDYFQQQWVAYTPLLGAFDSARIHYHRTQKKEADAWGTVITPYGSYDVLRIKVTESSVDTSYYHTPGAGWGTGTAAGAYQGKVSYHWVAGNGDDEVAELTSYTQSSGTLWRYRFAKPERTASVTAAVRQDQPVLWPNPARSTVTLRLNHTGSLHGRADIYDAVGRTVKAVPLTGVETTTDITALSRGVYFVKVIYAGYSGTVKFIKE